MSTIKPRHAIAYHALLDKGTQQYNLYYDGIRQTYDGPLSIASDLMVWNLSKDQITERMAVVTRNAWAVPGTAKQPPPQRGAPDRRPRGNAGGHPRGVGRRDLRRGGSAP